MSEFRRSIHGVLVEMEETATGVFRVSGDGRFLVVLTRTAKDAEQHGRWFCPCGHDSGKRNPMLAHVVTECVTVSPLLTADKGQTFEAMNTYLRLAGKHADPTYKEAMKEMYGSSW